MKRTSTPGAAAAAPGTTESVRAAIASGQLVVVIGTGVSRSLSAAEHEQLAWMGLIRDGLRYAAKAGLTSDEQRDERLRRLGTGEDVDDLIDVAGFVQRKLGAPDGDLYGRWLRLALEHARHADGPLADALRRLAAAKVPIATLNYDLLLEGVTGLPSITLDDPLALPAWLSSERPAILHLHGMWTRPAGCVLGVHDYAATVVDERRAMLQRSLGALKQLLFVGCGDTFADPNFLSLVRWLRQHMGAAQPHHQALVRAADVEKRAKDPSWRGFVAPMSFGAEFADLPRFLSELIPKVARKRNVPVSRAPAAPRAEHARALQAYRELLVKDCGQMSIEGVQADMETAQRKFDLERLFVPLEVKLMPSRSREGDGKPEAERPAALEAWMKGRTAVPFGEAFAHERRLVLLALPGGGKTMLLKRLVVAYLQPELRRTAVADDLPELTLLPVLIRCREWREHIRRPILTLLGEIGRVTGQLGLESLRDALVPHFEDGSALLLIDGLDEIHDPADRAVFVDHVEKFGAQFPNARLVVTSREAGFDLVAPNLRRLCSAWRIEPLNGTAIALLCRQWQHLMMVNSPAATAEIGALIETLRARDGRLLRFAENPLLLTMLLVVKQGAGNLPLDRVSLYRRAVEVLLDTWNIQGHAKLSERESVPQLACAAFELLKQGRQAATADELIELFEQARGVLPTIHRYAQDSPARFLERVELRSSLLIGGGRALEGERDVPLYEFRHLTFQEYLAALAACKGHYLDRKPGDDVLTPLAPHLFEAGWKEVVPMAAVMAGQHAEPLLRELIRQAGALAAALEAGRPFADEAPWLDARSLPPALDRLLACFAEEVEAPPATAGEALRLIALFARGDVGQQRVGTIARGPYGAELWARVFALVEDEGTPIASWIEYTASHLGAGRVGGPARLDDADAEAIRAAAAGDHRESVCLALFMVAGLTLQSITDDEKARARSLVDGARLVELLGSSDVTLRRVALWTWAVQRQGEKGIAPIDPPPAALLDRLVRCFLDARSTREQDLAGFALHSCADMPRAAWSPRLSAGDRRTLRRRMAETKVLWETWVAVCVIAFHDGRVWSDADLMKQLVALRQRTPHHEFTRPIVQALIAEHPELAAEANDATR